MSIFDSISDTIVRYGRGVELITGDKMVKTKAFVQPLRYKNRVYIGGTSHKLGYRRIEKYLYIGPPGIEVLEKKTIIMTNDRKYIVKRSEKYYIRDKLIYVWAILQPCGEDLVDDYESD